LKNGRESRDLGEVSETGHLLQSRLRLGRQTDEFCNHEIHHIVGVSLTANTSKVPGPTRSIVIKGEHSFFGQRRNELNGEERIATRLFVHQLRERRAAFRLAPKCVPNQLPKMLLG